MELSEEMKQQLEEIVTLNSEIFAGMYENEPYTLAQYKDRLYGKEPILFMVRTEGRLAASSVGYVKKTHLYVWVLGVHEDFRRQGMATRLMMMNEHEAKERGLDVCVKVYNVSPGMQMLLLGRGYKVVGFEEGNREELNAVLYRLRQKDKLFKQSS